MKVLVTGHRGYIGAVLCPMLRERGHAVIGIDSGYFEGCDFGGPPMDVPTFYCDVRDVVGDDLLHCEGVIHLAALSNDPIGELDSRLTDAINHRASVRLARLAKAAGVRRFIFSSSCSVYGIAHDPVNEDGPVQPLSAYSRSKIDAERGIAELANERFCPVFLRNGTAYGVSERMRFDLVVNSLVGWAVTTGALRVMGAGLQWRPLIHVMDIAQAMCLALEAPTPAVFNEVLNVGSDEQNYQVRDVVEIVQGVIPGLRTERVDDQNDKRSYRVDFSKIRRALPDFAPQWCVEGGAREVYQAVTKLKLVDGRLSQYIRFRWLQELLTTGELNHDLRRPAVNADEGE